MMTYRRALLLTVTLIQFATGQTSFQPSGAPFKAPVTVAPPLTASVIFSNLTTPRGIAFDSLQNLLVVERGLGITAFTPVTGGWERKIVISSPNFTQGIQVDGDKLYLSTATDAWVYQYDATTKSVTGSGSIVVSNFPAGGELTTHTLQLESSSSGKKMLIATGPLTNIDPTARDATSGRSQVRRFSLNVPGSQTFLSGELVVFGIRNPAGFAFSPIVPSEKLYIVENGASIDNVTGLTSMFVNDNPADELELVKLNKLGKWYGFPDCTTIWNPTADPVGDPQYVNFTRGEQFSLMLEPGRDDAWCQMRKNNVPPVLSFQAHSVPLDIKFYVNSPNVTGALPYRWKNDAVVSFHGSFNRIPPTGYGVVRVPFDRNGNPNGVGKYKFLIQATNLASCPGSCIRPVGLAFGGDGKLFVSSDTSGEVNVAAVIFSWLPIEYLLIALCAGVELRELR